MTKYTEINGKRFETHYSCVAKELCRTHKALYSGKDLLRCYGRPSDKKRAIYNEWREWFAKCDEVNYMEIVSHSRYAFTLGAIYGNPDTGETLGYVKITKSHNQLFLIPEND